MKQLVQTLLQTRQIIVQDFLVGLRLSIGGALFFTGLSVISLALVAAVNPDFQRVAQRTVAGFFPDLALLGAAQAAELARMSGANAAPPAREDELPAALLLGIPTVEFSELNKEQQAAAMFLSRKYGLAPDAIAGLVCEAYRTGKEFQLDPLLLLAVMSIESSMNPFAQSSVGAQGLMQIMTTVHAERFEAFGGPNAALNPVANIRVGAQILRDLHQKFGTTPRALKAYVGATDHAHDAGYGMRVLTERARLESAVTGQPFKPPVLQQTVLADPKALYEAKSATSDAVVSTAPAMPTDAAKNTLEPGKDGAV